MPRTIEEIKDDIQHLSLDERGEIFDWLCGGDSNSNEQEIEQEWLDVAEARMKEFHEGKVNAISGEQVLKEIKENLGI